MEKYEWSGSRTVLIVVLVLFGVSVLSWVIL
jgi:hypothetical protein